MVRALVTGASGYVGSRLTRELLLCGLSVGCVVRDPSRVTFEQVTVHRADMLDPSSLSAIGDGYTTAYYLVHSMGVMATTSNATPKQPPTLPASPSTPASSRSSTLVVSAIVPRPSTCVRVYASARSCAMRDHR
jgi:hypothetical protein